MAQPRFEEGTTNQDAQALVMAAVGVIAGGWPVIYFRQPVVAGGQVALDRDAMIRDAVELAVKVQEAALWANRDEFTPAGEMMERV
jgi:hypothetical protein